MPAPFDGVAPEHYHAMSIFPEYFKVNGQWLLAEESRMDCVAVYENGRIIVREFRLLRKGDLVFTGRTEDATDGIYVHPNGFREEEKERRRLPSARTARVRRPSPAIMTSCMTCCATSVTTARSSGSWARPSPLTMTPARPWPS